MPAQLHPGVLYVSEEFETAAHLCAFSCGSKIRTPLGPTEWTFTDDQRGPSLAPSVGNWQRPCQSHYWITHGDVEWSTQWSPAQIAAGRQREERRRHDYYKNLSSRSWLSALWNWIKSLFS